MGQFVSPAGKSKNQNGVWLMPAQPSIPASLHLGQNWGLAKNLFCIFCAGAGFKGFESSSTAYPGHKQGARLEAGLPGKVKYFKCHIVLEAFQPVSDFQSQKH